MNSYNYTISPEQLDLNGLATVPSLYKMTIDSIAVNIRKEGLGVDVLADSGWTWALARCAIEFTSRPKLYDDIRIDVWSGQNQGLSYGRCVRVLASDGHEIGHGVTDWCVLDKSSRRPQQLSYTGDAVCQVQPCESAKRIKPFTSALKKIREVGYSECDFNGHLNNSRYVEMFFDMLPQAAINAMNKFRLDINFRREVPCGSTVEAFLADYTQPEFDFCMYYQGVPACCASVAPI